MSTLSTYECTEIINHGHVETLDKTEGRATTTSEPGFLHCTISSAGQVQLTKFPGPLNN